MEQIAHRHRAGLGIATVGLVFLTIHAVHGLREVDEELSAALTGVVLPLFVSLAIVAAAYWITQQVWQHVSPVWIFYWMVGGILVGLGSSSLLILYQSAEDVAMSDPEFVLAMFGTYGAAAGVLFGRYDLERRTRHHEQREQAEQLEQFASIVSHDLRNPLNVAEGRLELAREECGSAHLEDVELALERMEVLIEDLLTLARSEEAVLELEDVGLQTVSESCWHNVDTAGGTLRAPAELHLCADRNQLQQLLENLYRNAVTHGGDSVEVRVGRLGERGFFVEDDGAGIPEADREEIFDPGYSTEQDGTGFGLAIVRQVCEAHGWDILATDSRAGGARFEITGVVRPPC